MAYYLLTIAYDGTDFHGWQKQPRKKTVQGDIEAILSSILNERVEIHSVSRTDAGVHAIGQMAGFTTNKPIPPERLMLALNNVLFSWKTNSRGGAISIQSVRSDPELQNGFHARHSAIGKTYVYSIMSSPTPDIFLRNHHWQVSFIPDIEKMREAAVCLVGEHDFKAFQTTNKDNPDSTVKTVYNLQIYQRECHSQDFFDFKKMASDIGLEDSVTSSDHNVVSKTFNINAMHEYNEKKSGKNAVSKTLNINAMHEYNEKKPVSTTIVITGSGFLYNMVRIITGTLMQVGEGKRPVEDVKNVLESRDRTLAGPTAPPHGLYLARVHY